jgi:cytochrome P450
MIMRAHCLSCVRKPLRFNIGLHSMTTLPHASHAFRKKGYAPHYTPTNLAQFQPEMQQSALELVNV